MIHFILPYLLKKECYLCSRKGTNMNTLCSSWNSSHFAIAISNGACIYLGSSCCCSAQEGDYYVLFEKNIVYIEKLSLCPLVKPMLMNLSSLNFSYGLIDVPSSKASPTVPVRQSHSISQTWTQTGTSWQRDWLLLVNFEKYIVELQISRRCYFIFSALTLFFQLSNRFAWGWY